MERIIITIPGRPVPQARPRVNVQAVRRGRGLFTFLPAKTRNYQKLVASKCMKSKNPSSPKTVYVFIWLMAPTKVSVFTLRPDLDNFVKSAFDGLQAGGVIEDDAYILEMHAFTYYVLNKEQEQMKIMIVSWDGPITREEIKHGMG